MNAPAEKATQRAESSPPVRLAKGEIPQTWSRPAEQVSQLPIRAPRPLTSAIIVVAGAAVGFGLALYLAPTRGAPPAQKPPAPPAMVAAPPAPSAAQVAIAATPPVEPAVPKPVAAIPAPPPTSSTSPGEVAPEDQGGDDQAVEPSEAAETPARSKARKETDRAKALFASGELIGAESPLIRATLGDPSFAEGWRMLGKVRDALGNTEGARRAYKHFLQLAPTAPEAKAVRAALATLAQAQKPATAAATPSADPAMPSP